MRSPRRLFFWGVVAVLNAAVFFGGWKAYKYFEFQERIRLNRSAWEASYSERGLQAPEHGPRDGYWGANMGEHTPHPTLRWMGAELTVPGMLEFDANGIQHVSFGPQSAYKILIIGGSVALGAYASSIEKTYFHQLGAQLRRDGIPTNISVMAVGGWKSIQELQALHIFGLALKPDLVLFVSGLNDLTIGSNARTLFGTRTETLDGSPWHLMYHEHDYMERAAVYLENMRAARDLLLGRKIAVAFALQPALFEKKVQSDIEKGLEEKSLRDHASKQSLLEGYEGFRQGLRALSQSENVYFIDCSKVYDGEKTTTFADLWHFSDPGHDLLGARLYHDLQSMLKQLSAKK